MYILPTWVSHTRRIR